MAAPTAITDRMIETLVRNSPKDMRPSSPSAS
jgi:hypothetical protein